MYNDDIFSILMAAEESMVKADLGVEDSYEAYAIESALESACYEDDSYGWDTAMEADEGSDAPKEGFWSKVKNALLKVLHTIIDVVTFIPKWLAKKIKEFIEKVKAKHQEKEKSSEKNSVANDVNEYVTLLKSSISAAGKLFFDSVIPCHGRLIDVDRLLSKKSIDNDDNYIDQARYFSEIIADLTASTKQNTSEIKELVDELQEKRKQFFEKHPISQSDYQSLFMNSEELSRVSKNAYACIDGVNGICNMVRDKLFIWIKMIESDTKNDDNDPRFSSKVKAIRSSLYQSTLTLYKSILSCANEYESIAQCCSFFGQIV